MHIASSCDSSVSLKTVLMPALPVADAMRELLGTEQADADMMMGTEDQQQHNQQPEGAADAISGEDTTHITGIALVTY